jgi:hypothetical protein
LIQPASNDISMHICGLKNARKNYLFVLELLFFILTIEQPSPVRKGDLEIRLSGQSQVAKKVFLLVVVTRNLRENHRNQTFEIVEEVMRFQRI